MAKTQILDYYIHLTDKAQVDRYNDQLATGGPGVTASPDGVGSPIIFVPHTGKYAILRAPEAAAVEFSAPLQDEGVNFSAPATRSPWFVPGANNFPRNVATFTRKSGAFFGLAGLFGAGTTFKWAGHFVFAQGATPVDGNNAPVTVAAPIPKRLAIVGFEMNPNAESDLASETNAPRYTHDAAAHFGDRGYANRDQVSSQEYVEVQFGSTQYGLWSRFHLRARAFGSSSMMFFKSRQFGSAGEGFALAVTPSGSIAMYWMVGDAPGDETLLGSAGTVVLGRRHRIDVLTCFKGLACTPCADTKGGTLDVYLDGTKIATFRRAGLGGLIANVRHASVRVGKVMTSTVNGGFDIDNLICAELPLDKDIFQPVWASSTSYNAGDIVQGSGGVFIDCPEPTVPGDATTCPSPPPPTAPSSVVAYRCLVGHSSTAGNAPGTAGGAAFWERIGPSPDWVMGSRVVRIDPTGDGAARSGFTGDWRIALQNPPDSGGFAEALTSVTTGAVLDLTTNAPDIHKIHGQRGVVAIAVGMYGNKGGGASTDGSVGLELNGGGVVSVPVVQSATEAFDGAILYNPTGLTAGVTITSLNIRFTLGTVASGTVSLRMLQAVAELIGIFGQEDVPPGTVDVPPFPSFHAGHHNRHVPRSPWARSTSRAIAPIIVHTGTYVGNGVGTDLTFRVPPHFLFVRRVTGTADIGARWFAGMIGGHQDDDAGTRPAYVVTVEADPTFVPSGGEDDQAQRFRLRIAGADAQINAGGVTYHYIAICDPGARFLLTGGLTLDDGGASPENYGLGDVNFTPEAGFFWPELRAATGTGQAAFKGLGLALNEAIELPATARTNYVRFNAGSLDVYKGATGMLDAEYEGVGYALFRRNDGNGGAEKAFALVTWIGDGAASRTINTGFITGTRPVWAWAAAVGGSAFFRDAQHTGSNSTNVSTGTQGTTGITSGAPDAMSVGSLLNANSVVYTAIIFMGSATAGNNGWSIDGEFVPIEPDYIKDPNWVEPTEITITFPAPGTPTGPLIATPDLDTSTTPGTSDLGGSGPLGSSTVNTGGLVGGQPCEVYTRQLLNMALQRIGQTKVIANAATDNTIEAAMARQFILEDVNQVLRDFPWPFATRYSTLVLVGGTSTVPVNNDWQYSYRAPSGMMFPRRIAKAGNARAFDPSPIPFREVSDATGHLIFCNEPTSATVPLVLEWTARITCPAFYGDAMFRDALCWRFAASFAMALAKDSDKQTFCMTQYQAVLNFAQADALNAAQPQPAPLSEGDADWIRDRN